MMMENSSEETATKLEANRFLGCLMGLAVGDALGTTLEFKKPGTFQPISDMIGGGPFHLEPGQWTDDTSMVLCLAESLLEKGWDPADQMSHYLRWYQEGYLSSNGKHFDIGNTTRQALCDFKRTREPFSGSADPQAAGNGSLMRLAPVVMAFARRPIEAICRAADSSRTTHGASAAVDACRYFGGLLAGALAGEPKKVLLGSLFSPVKGYWDQYPLVPAISAVASGSFKEKQPPAIKGSGYVVKCLDAALWAFHNSSNFKDGCLLAVNLGDDADTTGAVYGQFAGAFYGLEGIPKEWIDKIAMRDLILDFGRRLHAMAG